MSKKKKKILVVEDSETQYVVLRHILKSQGWSVTRRSSAESALEYLFSSGRNVLPDLIILDFHLPGMKGDELSRHLKLNINTRGIPLLMLTTDTDKESEKHGLESGADDYLSTDIDEGVLVMRISALMRKSRDSYIQYGVGRSLFKSSRVMAVDADPAFLEFLESSLKTEGIFIDKSSSFSGALDRISKVKYDCIIVSQTLQDKDGDTFPDDISVLKESIPEIAILILTDTGSKDNMIRALEAGADDFVLRTSDFSYIKTRLFALLRRKYIQDDNKRIFEELKRKELEVERSRIEKTAAEAKVLLAEKLLKTVEQLEEEIEERKRMEIEIKNYSQQLERSNKELESFAYVASHDLQEPLRAISSFLQLVNKRYAEKIDDKGKDFISRAVNGAQRMQKMINDLLIYSRITTRAGSFEPVSFDRILDRAFTNLSASIERSDANITHSPMPELPCDESQIIRLFQNLLSNAIKFCGDKKPKIQISANESGEKNAWLFTVKDNGIGIEPEHLDNIFKIFHRLHSRRKYPGTGIGLAICQKIVERHGGNMWVESETGKGSSFYFTLAIPQIPAGTSPEEKDRQKSEQEEFILGERFLEDSER
jgi:signal transduction histidine kinase